MRKYLSALLAGLIIAGATNTAFAGNNDFTFNGRLFELLQNKVQALQTKLDNLISVLVTKDFKGDKGDPGEMGPLGPKGDTGEQGPPGPPGISGGGIKLVEYNLAPEEGITCTEFCYNNSPPRAAALEKRTLQIINECQPELNRTYDQILSPANIIPADGKPLPFEFSPEECNAIDAETPAENPLYIRTIQINNICVCIENS